VKQDLPGWEQIETSSPPEAARSQNSNLEELMAQFLLQQQPRGVPAVTSNWTINVLLRLNPARCRRPFTAALARLGQLQEGRRTGSSPRAFPPNVQRFESTGTSGNGRAHDHALYLVIWSFLCRQARARRPTLCGHILVSKVLWWSNASSLTCTRSYARDPLP
jgi:hypothetical protein